MTGGWGSASSAPPPDPRRPRKRRNDRRPLYVGGALAVALIAALVASGGTYGLLLVGGHLDRQVVISEPLGQQTGNDATVDPDIVRGPHAEGWHAALDMINGGQMPPDDEPQMSDEQRRLVVVRGLAQLARDGHLPRAVHEREVVDRPDADDLVGVDGVVLLARQGQVGGAAAHHVVDEALRLPVPHIKEGTGTRVGLLDDDDPALVAPGDLMGDREAHDPGADDDDLAGLAGHWVAPPSGVGV